MNDTINDRQGRTGPTGAITKLAKKGVVSARDVAILRRKFRRALARAASRSKPCSGSTAWFGPECEAWAALLAEVVTDHVVWDCRPTGIVTKAMPNGCSDGRCLATLAGLGVLIEILEGAHRVPYWFAGAVRRRAVAGWTDGPKPKSKHWRTSPTRPEPRRGSPLTSRRSTPPGKPG